MFSLSRMESYRWEDYENWIGSASMSRNRNEPFTKLITPLQYSIEKGDIEIIQILLNNDKIDVNIKNKIYKDSKYDRSIISSLYYAVQNGKTEIVQLLLENEKVNDDTPNIYEHYNSDGNAQCIYKVERKVLHIAIEKGFIDIVKLLLNSEKINVNDAKIDFNYSDDKEGCFTMVNKTEMSPLNIAIYKNNIDIIKLLLENDKYDINSYSTYMQSEKIRRTTFT